MAFELVNVMQIVVETMTNEIIRKEGVCDCEQCKMDVMAIALNKLPPKYVVSEQGRAYETYRIQGVPQSRVPVYQALLEAAQLVKKFPRHHDERSIGDKEKE